MRAFYEIKVQRAGLVGVPVRGHFQDTGERVIHVNVKIVLVPLVRYLLVVIAPDVQLEVIVAVRGAFHDIPDVGTPLPGVDGASYRRETVPARIRLRLVAVFNNAGGVFRGYREIDVVHVDDTVVVYVGSLELMVVDRSVYVH